MTEKNKPRSNNLVDTKDIQFIFRLFWRNLGVLIFLPLVAYAIGYIYAYRLQDVYQAKAQLLLKSDKTYDYQDPIYKGLGAYGMYMDVRNQIRILQSRDLISRVVDKMDANTSYFVKGRLKMKEVFGTLPFRAEADIFNPEQIYEKPIDVEILNENEYTIQYQAGENTRSFQGEFETDLVTPEFSIKLSRNYSFDEENINRIVSSQYRLIMHSDNYMISHFQQRMTIENLEHTSILALNVQDDIGSRAKVFLDTLCQEFVNYSKKSQLEVNMNTLENIDKQITEVQKILNSIETQLILYKDSTDIISPEKEEDTYYTLYIDYSGKKRDLYHKLSSVKLLEEYVQTSPDEHLLPPSFYILDGDVYLQKKVSEFYDLQLDITDESENFSETHPIIIKMKEDLVVMRKDILTYIKNLKTAINQQIEDNERMIGKYKSNVQGIPRLTQGVDNIKRELDVNNKMYLFLLEKKTNTLIARAGIIPQVQIIESPSLAGVVGPDKGKIRKLFLLGGLVIALIFAFIKSYLFERTRSIAELEEYTENPVLGGIPYVKDLSELVIVDKQPKAQVTESFRNLRANLNFLTTSDKSKIIVVSSFFPSEGKTFCSTNLSTILASSDKKVLLIDFDLHKPKVHKVFGIENNIGISNIIIGKATLDQVLLKDIRPNLDVITCGSLPPNPSELVTRDLIQEFLTEQQKKYDYIILDTPPFGLLSDSVSLSKLADSFLVVVNAKFARKLNMRKIDRVLEKTIHTHKGLILNGIRQNKINYYYSKYSYKYGYSYGRYGYGYGYGYEYGETDGSEETD